MRKIFILLLCASLLLVGCAADTPPPATMINAAGDYVVSYIVSRFVDGKDWLQKVLSKNA